MQGADINDINRYTFKKISKIVAYVRKYTPNRASLELSGMSWHLNLALLGLFYCLTGGYPNETPGNGRAIGAQTACAGNAPSRHPR